MKVPNNIKDAFDRALKQRRIVVGTASKQGVPNAVPVANFPLGGFLDDETLIITDVYFLKTRKNLEENPQLALTLWDMEEKEGRLVPREAYQLKGKAKIENSGQLYEKVKKMRPQFPVKAIVLVKVEEVYDVKGGPNAGKRIA